MALLVVCLLASSAVIVAGFRRLGAHDAADLFLRIIAAAGISSVGSVLLELFHSFDPSVLLRVGADAAVAVGPATVWVALCSIRGRLLVPALLAAGGTLVVAVASVAIARPASFGVLLGVVGVFCASAVAQSYREPLRGLRGHVLAGTTLTFFAAYCFAALAIGVIAGWESAAYDLISSWAVWTVVSAGTITAIGVAAMLIAGDLRPRGDTADSSVAATGRRVRVSIPDFALMPSAFGAREAAFLDSQLMRAARETDPGATSIRPGSYELSSADPTGEVERRVQHRFSVLAAADATVVEKLVFAWAQR
jgi:hypothetical protein